MGPARSAVCRAPASGRSFWHRAGAIRRGSRLPQKTRAACTTERHARAGFVGPRPRGEAFRAPSWRHSPRVAAPTEKACGLHNAAPCTDSICRSSDHGAKLFAPSWRHSPRGAAPTAKACDLHNAALCTGWICRSPDPGAKLLAPSLRHSPRVAPPAEKSVRPAQRSAMHGLHCGRPTRGEAFGTELAPFASGRSAQRSGSSRQCR